MNKTVEIITYKKGYKYQLVEDYSIDTGITAGYDSNIGDYIVLTSNGTLTIKAGYAWDGPSGPTVDTSNFMRGSLVHDALYQLMRNNKLPKEKYRDGADVLLEKMCKQDKMSKLRAKLVYLGLKFGGAASADPANKKRPIVAP